MLKLLAISLPFVPLICSAAAFASLALLNHNPPRFLEPALSLIAAPLLYIFKPIYPILRPLGMVEGEWMRLPTLGGMVIGSLIYGIIIFAIQALLTHRKAGAGA